MCQLNFFTDLHQLPDDFLKPNDHKNQSDQNVQMKFKLIWRWSKSVIDLLLS